MMLLLHYVAVDTAKGLAIMDGLCTIYDNWNVPAALQANMEFLVPTIHNDPVQAYESMMKIKKMADIKVPLHEVRFTQFDSIPA